MNILKNNKGFTLIEIIAVLLIFGIMATVAVKKFIGFDAKSRIDHVQTVAQDRKDKFYEYAGIEKSEEDAATDVETEEKNSSE